jgi:hypothetical protein
MIVVGEPSRWTEAGPRTVGADRSQPRLLCDEIPKDIGSRLHAPFSRYLVDNARLEEPGHRYPRHGLAAPRACAPGGRVQLP